MIFNKGFISVFVLLASLVIAGVVLAGAYYFVKQQSSSPSVTSNKEDWKTYQNSTFTFELSYPSNLTLEERTGSNPLIGDDWVRVILRDTQNDFGLIFFAGQSSMGGAGEGYSTFQTKKITIAGKEVQELFSVADGASEDVLLSVYTRHSGNRFDNFYSTFKKSKMETVVPRIEAIIATLRYTDSTP